MTAIPLRHHHVSLAVIDLDAQCSWYASQFGFTSVNEQFEVAEMKVRTAVICTPEGLRLELIERAGATPTTFNDPLDAAGTQGYGHWGIQVPDVLGAFDQLTANGATAVWPPAPAVRPGDVYAYVKDPEGNLIELIQVAAD
jgi:catechol 2,3-dioxygenase-like lactoylglutathione lyase family enzyme